MFEYSKTSTILTKTIGLPILILLTFFDASFLVMNASAVSVYQCATHNGKVIFTDSPAQLHECQELTFYMSEERFQSKAPQSQRDYPPDRETPDPQELAMINEELFSSSSHEFEDEEFLDEE